MPRTSPAQAPPPSLLSPRHEVPAWKCWRPHSEHKTPPSSPQINLFSVFTLARNQAGNTPKSLFKSFFKIVSQHRLLSCSVRAEFALILLQLLQNAARRAPTGLSLESVMRSPDFLLFSRIPGNSIKDWTTSFQNEADPNHSIE